MIKHSLKIFQSNRILDKNFWLLNINEMKNHIWATPKGYRFGKETRNCDDLYIASLNFGNGLIVRLSLLILLFAFTFENHL